MDSKIYIDLLRSLIQIPSFSGEEAGTADVISSFFIGMDIPSERLFNNIIARNKYFRKDLPTIILNSHHDTVGVGAGWFKDPFGAEISEGKLFGRGSNDAGGALVSLIATFCHFYNRELPYNLVLIASGEEENFGKNGVASVLEELDFIPSLAIIGEPTEMHLAIAEKGLIVIDAVTKGKSGHAARGIGINAIYSALEDINWIKNLQWKRDSEVLGKTKTTVTQINAGKTHNVIPDQCRYVIDCRVNELYTLKEVFDILNRGTSAELIPRSLRWHPSGIDQSHPIITQGLKLNRELFGSPTLSDQVHYSCPTVKVGPGKSERSHTADEYIYLSEMEEGIQIYIALLEDLQL